MALSRRVPSTAGLASFLSGERDVTLTEKQIDEMRNAAMPLMIWLEKNCHQHVQAIVHNTQIEVLEGLAIASRIERQPFDE